MEDNMKTRWKKCLKQDGGYLENKMEDILETIFLGTRWRTSQKQYSGEQDGGYLKNNMVEILKT